MIAIIYLNGNIDSNSKNLLALNCQSRLGRIALHIEREKIHEIGVIYRTKCHFCDELSREKMSETTSGSSNAIEQQQKKEALAA